ncbi:MAG: hypothetical protein HGB11_12670, partial [Chlorobiales bacterium]|nr:hypothetical protein [Chlorobiales bacterium]
MQRVYSIDTYSQANTALHAEIYIDKQYRDRPLLYRIPDELLEAVRPGCRVLVSGAGGDKQSQERLGFVIKLSKDADETVVAGEVLDIFDDGEPVLNETLLRLTEWLSDYYLSWPIEAIHAALPSALRVRPKETVCLKEFQLQAPDEKLIRTALRKRIMQELGQESKLSVGQIERRTGSKYLRYALSELQRAGYVEVKKTFVQKGKPKLKTAYRLSKAYSPAEIEAVLESLNGAKKQLEIFQNILSLPAPFFFKEDV